MSDLISLPFQNNTNFDFGPDNEEQNILNIQPVMPFRLNEEWNLISRTIVPIIHMPELIPGDGETFGLGDTFQSLFFSPAKSGKAIWGIGPAFQVPTATDDILGQDKWSAGPTGVILAMRGPMVFGALANNVWSFVSADNGGKPHVNQMFLQPFFNYNFRKGWYLTSSPIITANWKADDGEQWVIPMGGGGGKIFKIGKQAMNAQAQVLGTRVALKASEKLTVMRSPAGKSRKAAPPCSRPATPTPKLIAESKVSVQELVLAVNDRAQHKGGGIELYAEIKTFRQPRAKEL